jgi:hypothetical protein
MVGKNISEAVVDFFGAHVADVKVPGAIMD